MLRPHLVCLLACASCATSTAPKVRKSAFPSPETLSQLQVESQGVATTALADGEPMERLRLAGPGFTEVASAPMLVAFGPSYESKRSESWRYTRAMVCAADKVAEYAAEAGGSPPLDVTARIGPACGVTASSLRYAVTTIANAGELDVEQVEEAKLKHFQSRLDVIPRDQTIEMGFAAIERAGQLRMVLAFGRIDVQLDSATLRGTELIVEGLVRVPADLLAAMVTHGPYGFRYCVGDPEVALPRFRVACPVAGDDDVVRFSVSTARRGEVLADVGLQAIFSRGSGFETEIVRSPAATVALPTPEELTQAVNVWRGRAELEPVRLESRQSAFASSLTPRFFEEQRGGDRRVLEQIMLGVQAGYEVEEPIVDADFSSRTLPWSASALDLVTALVEEPTSRKLVLSPRADRVAFGISGAEASGVVGLMVSSYQGFDADTAGSARRRVLEILNRERSARGLPPAEEVRLVRNRSMVEEVVRQEASVKALMNDYLRQAASSFPGQRIGINTQTLNDVERYEPDETLLQAALLRIDLDVVIYRPLGVPWHEILIVVTRVASDSA